VEAWITQAFLSGAKKMNMDDTINQVCALFERVKKWKWRTTGALEQELGLGSGTLFPILEEHASLPNRKIRYHKYPSRKLEVLWGVVSQVGENPRLPALRRADYPSEDTLRARGPLIFISHNHRDENTTKAIAQMLTKSGATPWLFEMEIEQDQPIIHAVHDSIQRCDGAIVFISRSALGSLWVHKEFSKALKEVNHSVLVILDGSDEALLEAIYDRNFAKVRKCMIGHDASDDQIRRAQNFAADIFNHTKPLRHPDPVGIKDWIETMGE